jgi:glyoxylase-like metal-dependent hydrolase (beta-lactamase superfamily II)
METRTLGPQLTLLRFSVGQAYVWRDGEELTLIDTGPAGSGPEITSVLAPLGRLRRIVLTHFHDDHAGSAAELATDGVQVLAHRADAPVIRGERPGPPPSFTPAERELHARVAAGLPPAPPARVDVELDQGDRLDVGGGALDAPMFVKCLLPGLVGRWRPGFVGRGAGRWSASDTA